MTTTMSTGLKCRGYVSSPYTHHITLHYNVCTLQNLEKHLIEVEGRLEEFEGLRDQLGQLEHLENLNEARDAVRRHVEAKQRLDKGDLDTLCESVSHTIVKMQPCHNADFQGT